MTFQELEVMVSWEASQQASSPRFVSLQRQVSARPVVETAPSPATESLARAQEAKEPRAPVPAEEPPIMHEPAPSGDPPPKADEAAHEADEPKADAAKADEPKASAASSDMPKTDGAEAEKEAKAGED